MRLSNELKTGMLFLLAVAVGILFFSKTVSLKQSTYDLKTQFTYAGDLQPNATVKLSGIEAGRLTDIKFIYDPVTKVECTMTLDSNMKIRKDAIAYIATSGFVGDAFIGLTTGTSNEFCAAGDSIASEDPVQMRLLMKKADSIANNLDNILVEVKSLVIDNRSALDNIVTNLESTSQNFKEFSEDVKHHPWKLLFKGE